MVTAAPPVAKETSMLISVIMCTRNRAEQLKRVLESAAAMDVPAGLDWEFVLVDNGSKDHTKQVVESFADRLPIRHVLEPKPGLSNARNTGVSAVRGDYICWTDDDVVIDRNWLASYAAAFARYPDAALFGGVIEPVLEGEQPDWFVANRIALSGLLAERDLGREPVALSLDERNLPYGANFAVRTAEQRQHLYDPELGVSPGQKRLGEETKVLAAILHAGGSGMWVPESRVRHMIPAARQTLDYVRVYQQSVGETWAHLSRRDGWNFMGHSIPASGRTAFGAPRWLWREAIKHRVKFNMHKARNSPAWFEHWCRYAYYRGAIEYMVRHRA